MGEATPAFGGHAVCLRPQEVGCSHGPMPEAHLLVPLHGDPGLQPSRLLPRSKRGARSRGGRGLGSPNTPSGYLAGAAGKGSVPAGFLAAAYHKGCMAQGGGMRGFSDPQRPLPGQHRSQDVIYHATRRGAVNLTVPGKSWYKRTKDTGD